MIIQSIAQLDQMDKDLNTFSMRVREWYSWHFPELKDLVKDNYLFARCAAFIQVTEYIILDSLFFFSRLLLRQIRMKVNHIKICSESHEDRTATIDGTPSFFFCSFCLFSSVYITQYQEDDDICGPCFRASQ